MILFLAMAASVGQSPKPAKLPPIKPIDLKTVPHPIAYPPLPVTMVPSPPPAPPIARQSGPNLPPQPANPQGNWIVGDDYPSAALRDEVQGEVVFSLAITKWGTLADCSITKSSGSAILDEATCRIIMRRARFYPATDKDMKPIAGTFSSKVKWVLPDNSPIESTNPTLVPSQASTARLYPSPPPFAAFPRGPQIKSYGWSQISNANFPEAARAQKREGTTLIRLGIGVSGDVTSCVVSMSSGHADLDAKSCEIAKFRFQAFPALGVNGEAVAGRIDTGVNWFLTGDDAANLPPPSRSPRPPIFERSGEMNMQFHQAKDGSVQNCQFSVTGLDSRPRPNDDICAEQARDAARRFVPYTDDKGNPVARDVSVTLKVRIDPPKGK